MPTRHCVYLFSFIILIFYVLKNNALKQWHMIILNSGRYYGKTVFGCWLGQSFPILSLSSHKPWKCYIFILTLFWYQYFFYGGSQN